MYSHTVVAPLGQTCYVTLPGARSLELKSDGQVDPTFLEGFQTAGMVTELDCERLKRYALTGDVSELGPDWKAGREAYLSACAYLPSPGQGPDVNPYAAARQVVDIHWKTSDPSVRVTTNVNQNDPQIYNHEMEGVLQQRTGSFSEVRESAHFTVGDEEYLFVDGEGFGWSSLPASEQPREQVAQVAQGLLAGHTAGIQEDAGQVYLPGSHLRKRHG